MTGCPCLELKDGGWWPDPVLASGHGQSGVLTGNPEPGEVPFAPTGSRLMTFE